MKISRSKQELARIISENGGWRDGEFSAQDGDGEIFFFHSKPTRNNGEVWLQKVALNGYCIVQEKALRNWHQTILSRAEYFHLYPAPNADGWIEFDGTERPSGYFNVVIDVNLENGKEITDSSGRFEWDTKGPSRIIAYRLHKPERSTVESRLADAVDIVKSAVPALMSDDMKFTGDEVMGERKQTIEQLAAEYRNKLDYANQKQDEADKANMESDAALSELEAAIAAIGFSITPLVETEKEPKLVITDWRDLQVGDVIQCVGDAWDDDFEGNEAVVTWLESNNYKYKHRIRARIGEESDWGDDFIFIRRP